MIGLHWGGAQNPLQRDCSLQTGSRCFAAFSDTSALGFFPMRTLEKAGGFQARPVDAVEAARVDRDPVGPRARYIKRMHAAMRAEGALRHARVEV
jgi:hypothetical protein